MNTFKLALKNDMAKELHNLEHSYALKEVINGKEIIISHPCNLHILVDDELDDELYISRLNHALDSIKQIGAKNIEISLTNVEGKSSNERLVEILRSCSNREFKFRTINTSGITMFDNFHGKPICRHMIENGCTNNININSVWKNEEHENRYVMDKLLLEKLAYYFNVNDADMRISLNTSYEGINSIENLKAAIIDFKKINITTLILREKEVSMKRVLANLEINDFEKLRTLQDRQYIVDVYQYHEYLAKHYITKNKSKDNIVTSMFFKNGELIL